MTTILVIEDEKFMREQITMFLSMQGYGVLEAADGESGVKQAIENEPDLILCDIMMPKMNGYQVLQHLYQDSTTQKIPFIFLTALADFSRMRQGMSLGADDYIVKPFTNKELLEAIKIRLHKRREYMADAERRLEEVRKNVVQLVAHELRTPLAPIKLVTELITMKLGRMNEKELQEYIDVISHSTRRISHLVQQIVYITEIETGTTDTMLRTKSPNIGIWDLLMSAVALSREYAMRNEAGEIDLKVHDQDVALSGDISMLKHALAEVITNALHFGKGHPVIIQQWYTADENMCWITVTDFGPGMSPKMVEYAFREFEQLNREAHEQQGIGLGLPVARAVIDLHGGTLLLESVEGKGTKVKIRLPCYPE